MNLYRRTPMGFLETHTLDTALQHMTNRSVIYYENPEDRDVLEGMMLMHGVQYILKKSCNYVTYDQWEWFTYSPRKHY